MVAKWKKCKKQNLNKATAAQTAVNQALALAVPVAQAAVPAAQAAVPAAQAAALEVPAAQAANHHQI